MSYISQTKLEDLEKEVIQMNSNGSTLQRTFAEFTELALVLEKAGGFFDKAKRAAGAGAFRDASSENPDAPLLESVSKRHALYTWLQLYLITRWLFMCDAPAMTTFTS